MLFAMNANLTGYFKRCVYFTFFLIGSRGFMGITILRGNRKPLAMTSSDSNILRQVDKWACVKSCGACCKLGPIESRPDLPEYLDEKEYESYKSMIGSDNWCKHFDQTNRLCTIYDNRPDFCRVEPAKYKKMFNIEEEEMNEFCVFCCQEQIIDVYGEKSLEWSRFNAVNNQINTEYDDFDEDDEEFQEEGEEEKEEERERNL
mmetsp:Transcript_6822/g.7066  ORF Transcript_6822/g.7066 Transcript_6822/m.7066 type:complete len:203 (-) Transcript_6822:82-690(-)